MIGEQPRFQGEGEEGNEKKEKEGAGEGLVQSMLRTRSILLAGEINKESAERVVSRLLLMEESDADLPIRLFIDSPGGDADAGYAIVDMIRFVKPKVTAIGMGLVASAGALVLLSVPRERRVGLPNSHYLIHQPLSGMRGVASDIEIHAREIERMKERINRHIADETGKDYEVVVRDTDRDFWLNAEEAIEYGLLSRVVRNRSELEMEEP